MRLGWYIFLISRVHLLLLVRLSNPTCFWILAYHPHLILLALVSLSTLAKLKTFGRKLIPVRDLTVDLRPNLATRQCAECVLKDR